MNFLSNKYSRWYFSIISNRRANPIDEYTENHHIIPKSLGGTKDGHNLVRLTAREHFICHLLLPKMTEGNDHQKMLSALGYMLRTSVTRIKRYAPRSSVLYEMSRLSCITDHSDETKLRISKSLKTYYDENPERRNKISQTMSKAHKGVPKPIEQRQKMSEAQKGIPKSIEQRKKISEATMNQPIKVCPHCNFASQSSVIYRWHFDK
jgi:hypothetical protein